MRTTSRGTTKGGAKARGRLPIKAVGASRSNLAERIRRVVATSYPEVDFGTVRSRLRLSKDEAHSGSHAENVFREAFAQTRRIEEAGRLKRAQA